jgi:hypothetical protein
LTRRATAWGLSADKLAELEPLHSEAKAPHEKCETASYTQLDMQAKNEKKDLLRKKEAEFARFHLQNNGKVSDNWRKEVRVPIYDKTPAPLPAPDSAQGGSPRLSTGLNVCGSLRRRRRRR